MKPRTIKYFAVIVALTGASLGVAHYSPLESVGPLAGAIALLSFVIIRSLK